MKSLNNYITEKLNRTKIFHPSGKIYDGLTVDEYNTIAQSIIIDVVDMLKEDVENYDDEWSDDDPDGKRILSILNRGKKWFCNRNAKFSSDDLKILKNSFCDTMLCYLDMARSDGEERFMKVEKIIYKILNNIATDPEYINLKG